MRVFLKEFLCNSMFHAMLFGQGIVVPRHAMLGSTLENVRFSTKIEAAKSKNLVTRNKTRSIWTTKRHL